MPRVFVHVPYTQLSLHLPFILENGINPEIFFSGEALEGLVRQEFLSIAQELKSAGLSCTIHAPFMDLNPGSLERLVREATMLRFGQVLDAASVLEPEVIVFHPGFDRWRYGEATDKWREHSVGVWQVVLEHAKRIGATVAIENIFEEEPSTLKSLFEEVEDPRFRHCFDVGHWNLFKKVGMEEWFEALGDRIAEVHIHDNSGLKDEHLPIGEGGIDFELFFSLMQRYAPHAAYTIEAHSREKVQRALAALKKYLPYS
ncbi:sugar phosphate isomerase/epimerase [Geomonas sp. RF6]|uniref:sugar phosphate isomerase/epimerase family protein n=1 Tax=Geomonas sp. RF6 TaxID=2897342 RepID=UPI001E2909D0|nr:sugar phosphate isomerase/epimerase family protein [Geomonas sp. RF6]UFS72371.1 sugar phosphate isomerase/epimerase [Geomonas sp. RF6]